MATRPTPPPPPPPGTGTAPPGAPLERIEIPPEEALRRGHIYTRVSRPVAWAMVLGFTLLAFGVPVLQAVIEMRRGHRPQVLDLFSRAPTRPNLHAFESELERTAAVKGALQPDVQAVVTAPGGFGNTQAVVGRDGWLFYRPGVDYVMGRGFLDAGFWSQRRRAAVKVHADPPHADPRPAILQFHEACRRAGARLVLVPIPDKAMLQPAQLSRRLSHTSPIPPANNPSFPRFVNELRAAGVDVFDAAPAVIDRSEAPRFLVQDTHWTPQWMERVARDLAAHIETGVRGLAAPAGEVRVEHLQVSRLGDLVDMLRLPAGQKHFSPQAVRTSQVLDGQGRPWRPRKDAEVLLLGDSFTNIYSAEPMGWGESAGFAEQVSRFLRRPLDRISRNDAGAYATRQMLADELAKGRDRLAGKKVVVWQFAVRELTAGDWRPIDMKLSEPKPATFVVPKPGEVMTVTGVVADVAPAPRPRSVPYKDHIVAVHLVDLETPAGPIEGGNALVFVWSMRDNVWTPAARYRPGQRVTLRLRPWADVSDALEAINRGELDDEEVAFQEPCWGEEVER